MHISICIGTYKRPKLLGELLSKLGKQNTGGRFTYSIVVADNDLLESARDVVEKGAASYPVAVVYCVEPRRSISHVRNMTIAQSYGELIAFIDDDEFPEDDWLLNLYIALEERPCAGVLGPVRPHFMDGTPSWVKMSGLFDRPEHETGFIMPWQECRTGNVLFHREILRGTAVAFRPEFGTGGSDIDFFRRMTEEGNCFIWCNTAPIFEYVLPSRWKRSVLLTRALLRGRNSARHPHGRFKNILKSLLAVPLYCLALPFLQLCGHRYFMLYLVKLCDHLGLLLASVGIDLIKQRPM